MDASEAAALQTHPVKGSLDAAVPVDPLLYRFHEITQVYGTTIKTLIEEKFGAGIMSAIDFEMTIDRVEDPKGRSREGRLQRQVPAVPQVVSYGSGGSHTGHAERAALSPST